MAETVGIFFMGIVHFFLVAGRLGLDSERHSSQTLLVLQIIFSIHPGDVTFIRKTEVTVIPYDEMFMNRYADDPARKNELACNGDVFL